MLFDGMNILTDPHFEPIYFHNPLIKCFGHPYQLKFLMRKIYVQQVGLFWLHVVFAVNRCIHA